MKIAVCSDLHLDVCGWKDPVFPAADILVIAGDSFEARLLWASKKSSLYDLGQECWDFINKASEAYEDVVFVAGNHEYYNSYISKVNNFLNTQMPNNFYVLNSEIAIIQNQLFYGGTIWTNMGDELDKLVIKQSMNDFRRISTGTRTFRPRDAAILHKKAMQDIANLPDGCVIVSHHAPSFKSIPEKYHKYTSLNKAYYSDWPSLDRHKLVIHGHTHDRSDYLVGGCRVYCNPRGYGQENPHFKIEVIEI